MNHLALISCGILLAFHGVGFAQTEIYESELGRFRALFPSKPKVETKTLATGKAGIAPIDVTTEREEASNGAVLAVVYVDYPDEYKTVPAKKLLDAVRDGLKGKDGRIKTDVNVEPQDPAQPSYRDLRIEAGQNVIRVRLYLVGTRLYQVMVTGDRRTVSHKECEQFVSSFQVVK